MEEHHLQVGFGQADLGDAGAGGAGRSKSWGMSVLASSTPSHSARPPSSETVGHSWERAPLLGQSLGSRSRARSMRVRSPTRLHQLVLRAHGDHLALVHDADAVGELLGLFHVVRGVEDGHAAGVQVFDAVEDGAAALRVDAHRGLVEVEEARLVQQRRADVHPALHAARVLVHPVLLPVDQADQLKHLVHPLVERRPAQPVHPPPEQRGSPGRSGPRRGRCPGGPRR